MGPNRWLRHRFDSGEDVNSVQSPRSRSHSALPLLILGQDQNITSRGVSRSGWQEGALQRTMKNAVTERIGRFVA